MTQLPLVAPMLAVAGELPAHNDGRYAVEMKWDGVRAVGYWDGEMLRLLSRNGNDITAGYPELEVLGAVLGSQPAVVDGEIVAYDSAGRPSFEALQARMHVRGAKVHDLAAQVPVTYLAFDLLHLHHTSTVGLPYAQRRNLLERLDLDGDHLATPPAFVEDPGAVLQASKDQQLEGVVVKTIDGKYLPGRRSASWTKVKHVHMQEVVIGGWAPGAGVRAGGLGSLLLGVHDEAGRLRYVGHVGTGFTDRALADLGALLVRLDRATSPFGSDVPRFDARDARWVTPTLVGEVTYTQWTREGRLRNPAWRGLRPDKAAAEVRRE